MKPEILLMIAAAGLGAYFFVIKPQALKVKEREAALALDDRKAKEQEAKTNMLAGIGTLITGGGKLATAGADVMEKINDML